MNVHLWPWLIVNMNFLQLTFACLLTQHTQTGPATFIPGSQRQCRAWKADSGLICRSLWNESKKRQRHRHEVSSVNIVTLNSRYRSSVFLPLATHRGSFQSHVCLPVCSLPTMKGSVGPPRCCLCLFLAPSVHIFPTLRGLPRFLWGKYTDRKLFHPLTVWFFYFLASKDNEDNHKTVSCCFFSAFKNLFEIRERKV